MMEDKSSLHALHALDDPFVLERPTYCRVCIQGGKRNTITANGVLSLNARET